MIVPKITKVIPQDNMLLYVEFENGQLRELDIKPYIEKFKAFGELNNPVLFRMARVDVGGMGIVWNDRIDLSRYDVWDFGKVI